MQFTCIGNHQEACKDRFYEDDNEPVFEHQLVHGGTLWETHGSPGGKLRWDGKGYKPGDWVIACYPAQVKAAMKVACPEHNGVVKAVYDYHTAVTYMVTVVPV